MIRVYARSGGQLSQIDWIISTIRLFSNFTQNRYDYSIFPVVTSLYSIHSSSYLGHRDLGQFFVVTKFQVFVNDSTQRARFSCVNFLRASAMLKHVRHTYRLDVRPSVRLSHAGIVSKRLNIVMLSSAHDSPFILVLCVSRSSRNSDGVMPCWAAKQR